MQICSLYSGSGGNAVFLRLGGVSLLVDAGKSARALCRSLSLIGVGISDIHAIFLTHEHRDHVAALENLLKKQDIPVHIPAPCAEHLPETANDFVSRNLVLHPIPYTTEIEGLTVTSFPTPHDSAASVGFRFSFRENGKVRNVGYATDIGYLSDTICNGLAGCEAVVLESNHDIAMLKDGPYPYALKQRILSRRGHLSNTDCASLAVRLSETGTRYILLAHLSEINNTPDIAYDEVFGAVAGSGTEVAIADPREPVWLLREEDLPANDNNPSERMRMSC